MAGNENRATDCDRGPAEKSSDICTATCTTEDKPRLVDNQVVTLAQRNERVLRQAHLLAVDIDMIEGTQTSKLLRTLAFRAWREVYVGAP